MKRLKSGSETESHKHELVKVLNEFGLNGMAILAMIRDAEEWTYDVGEAIVEQGKRSKHIYFLLTGSVLIEVQEHGDTVSMGERSAVTMLGEIAFFNDTPATATVSVAGKSPAIVYRLSYSHFSAIIGQYSDVRVTLARIGDMRMIRQLHGFIPYRMYMDMIGWRKDRFAIGRAFAEDLENSVNLVFKPALKENADILEVGDGPGLVSEILHESDPGMLDSLFLLVTELEESIANPGIARPSDFSRGGILKRTFDAIVAVQVFNVASRSVVDEQFKSAHRMLRKGGVLFAVKTQLLDITHDTGASGNLIFNSLEELVEKHWPGATGSKNLIETAFVDADLDPIMEWNHTFCGKAQAGALNIPSNADAEETVLLELLLQQAKAKLFDPEELHYRWLEWKAGTRGFQLMRSEKNPENAFFYLLLRKV